MVLHKLAVVCTDLSMLNVMLPNVMLYKCHVCCHFRLGLQVLEFHCFFFVICLTIKIYYPFFLQNVNCKYSLNFGV